MKDDKCSSGSSSTSSSVSSKLGGNHNNTGASVIIAAANAAATKVRQRKAGRKTGVLHNCHVYPVPQIHVTGYTNSDISEESSNYTDTSSVTTNGDSSTTESDKLSSELQSSDTSDGANNSTVEDDFFDERPIRTSQQHHSSGLDPITNRQIDKVINLFRARASITYEPTISANSPHMTPLDYKRKSTSAATYAKVNIRG